MDNQERRILEQDLYDVAMGGSLFMLVSKYSREYLIEYMDSVQIRHTHWLRACVKNNNTDLLDFLAELESVCDANIMRSIVSFAFRLGSYPVLLEYIPVFEHIFVLEYDAVSYLFNKRYPVEERAYICKLLASFTCSETKSKTYLNIYNSLLEGVRSDR